METPTSTPNRCRSCGKTFPRETLICPTCKEILVTSGMERRTPRGVVTLLVVVIFLLFAYAIYLGIQQLVYHRF